MPEPEFKLSSIESNIEPNVVVVADLNGGGTAANDDINGMLPPTVVAPMIEVA